MMMQRLRIWVRAWLVVATVIVVATVATVGIRDAQAVAMPVEAGDMHRYGSFFAREGDHRWSSAANQLRLGVLRDAPHIVYLTLKNGYPADIPAPQVTVNAGVHGSARWTIPSGDARVYSVLTMPHGQWRWDRTIDITSSVTTIGADGRRLGFVFAGATVAPTTLVPVRAYGYPVALFLLAVTAIYLFALVCAARPHSAAMIAGVVTTGVLGLLWGAPVATWPYVWWFVAGLWIAGAVVAVAWLSGLITAEGRVRGKDLPVWFALAWWAIPFVQQVLSADNVYIRLYDYEAWMGWLGLVLLGGSMLIRWSLRSDGPLDTYLRWLPLGAMVVLSVAFQSTVFERIFRYGSGDFSIWVDAATRWVESGQLYLVANVADNPFAGYKRPPFYIMLFTPFVGQDPLQILNGFRIINIALYLGMALVWMRMMWTAQGTTHARTTTILWWLAVLVIITNMQPLYETITFGQTDVILVFCMTLILWALRSNRPGWAGVVVALLTSLKIYPILFLAFFVAKRHWWGFVGFIVGMLAWNGIAVVVMGWDLHWMYLTKVVGHVGGTTAWIENQTIAGFLTRFYDNPFVMNRFALPGVARVASVVSMLVSAVVCVLALRDAPVQSSVYAIQYGLFVMLMVLAIPVAWMHYFTLLVLVYWLVVWHFGESTLSLRRAGAYAVSFAFIAYGNYRSFNYPEDYGAVTLLLGSYKLYAILVLLVLLAGEILRSQSRWASGWVELWETLRRRLQPTE
ncbi:MAG: hypothetical protein RLY87_365 [Chloroflexota bacterium]